MLVGGCSLPWHVLWEFPPSAAEIAADLARRKPATPGLNTLGFKVFRQVVAARPADNTALSPAGLGRMLLMAYAGARGGTRDAMATALGMPDQSETTLSNWAAASNPSLDRRGVEITMRDSAWIKAQFSVQQRYKDDLRGLFAAEVGAFQDAADGEAKLREWIRASSGGLLDGEGVKVSDSALLVLADVLVFKGRWADEFDKAKTQQRPFYSVPGQSTQVQMMQDEGEYGYAEEEGFQVIRLPYLRSVYAMYVILPQEGATESASVDGDRFARLVGMTGMKGRGQILMPGFAFGNLVPLTEILKATGLGVAFSDGADFGGIAPALKLETVDQAVRVQVDEEGTVAAAATWGAMGPTSAPKPFYMEVNRPFYFAIRDDSAQAVLFLGRVTKP